MDRLVVKGNQISEYINTVNRYIDEFVASVKYLDEEKKKLIWESDNYDIMIKYYDEMIKDYLEYTNRMTRLMDYLDRLLCRYDDSLDVIRKEYRNLEEEYNEVKHG